MRYTKYFKILKYAMKEMKKEQYTIHQHMHNFAVWTSSRAVQRGFTSTKNIANAIEKSGLKDFVESYNGIDKKDFKKFHIKIAEKLIYELSEYNCTYGMAAKIISIYLKTSLIIYNRGKNCNNIHPPLDKILIIKLIKCNYIKDYTYKPWRKFNKKDYWELITIIEKHKFNVDWEIEKFWKPFE